MGALVVNLLGGPGVRKSTVSAGVFYNLKMNYGINADLIDEYAKKLVWGDTTSTLDDQLYITAKQHHRQFIVRDKVDVAITDSPLLIGLLYDPGDLKSYPGMVLELFNKYDNLNILLERKAVYNPAGRMQTEEQASKLDDAMRGLLLKHNVPFMVVPGDETAIFTISHEILKILEAKKNEQR